MNARGARDFEGLRISTADWPIMLMEFPERLVPDAALLECLLHVEQLLKGAKDRGERTYTVTDLTRMYQIATASQRKLVGDWMSRTLPLQRIASLGGANVTPSTILRGLITAVYWFQPPPMPSIFVATRREAYAAAIKAFDTARLPLRPDLRAALATR